MNDQEKRAAQARICALVLILERLTPTFDMRDMIDRRFPNLTGEMAHSATNELSRTIQALRDEHYELVRKVEG